MLQELIRFLAVAEKVVPRNSTIEVLRNLCIKDGYVLATDLELIARMPVPDNRSYLIPFGIIKTVLKSKPGSIDFDLSEPNRIKINYDNKSVSFPRGEVADFPNLPEMDFQSIGEWSKEAVMLLHSQLPYLSNDELRPALNGVYLNQNGSFSSCATDGHVLRVISDMDPARRCELQEYSGILPKRVIHLLPRLVRETVSVSFSEDYFRFELEHGLTLYARTVEATYPDFARVIPKEFASAVELDVARLMNLTEAAKAFANKATMASVFEIDEDQLSIKVENTEDDVRWESSMSVGHISGEGLKVAMNLSYLEKVLDGIEGKQALWRYNDGNTASVFVETGDNASSPMNLIMPIRLPKEDEDG